MDEFIDTCKAATSIPKDLFHRSNSPRLPSTSEIEPELYSLLNYAGDGILVELYNQTLDKSLSIHEFEKKISDIIRPFLYNNGDGKFINCEEWMTVFQSEFKENNSGWFKKTRSYEKINDHLIRIPPCIDITPHRACWKLSKRGYNGESLLHVCYVVHKQSYLDIARTMVKCFPELTLDIYESSQYYGQNCIHLCIINSNVADLEFLQKYGANLNGRAYGKFFFPSHLQQAKDTTLLGLTYNGEYPLVLSGCLERYDILDYLMQQRITNPNLQDCHGNTFAHLMVIKNKGRLLKYALRNPRKKFDLSIKNNDKLSAMQLSCKLARADCFQILCQIQAKKCWSYGYFDCQKYPLHDVDSLNPDGSINYNSCLYILCQGVEGEHSAVFDNNEFLDTLLRYKWSNYIKQRFIKDFVGCILIEVILCAAIFLRPANHLTVKDSSPLDLIRVICEGILIFWTIVLLPFELGIHVLKPFHETKKKNRKLQYDAFINYLKLLLLMPDKIITIIGKLLFLLVVILRFSGFRDYEDVVLAISVLLLCFNLFFYCRCFTNLGPCILITYKIAYHNLLKVFCIYILLLAMFSPALFFLLKGSELESITPFQDVCLDLVYASLGTFNPDSYSKSHFPGVSYIFLTMFILISHVFCMQVLTAMTTLTYSTSLQSVSQNTKRSWALMCLLLEAQMFNFSRKSAFASYAISFTSINNLESNSDSSTSSLDVHQQYGIKVTVRTKYTRAFLRNRAYKNWRNYFVLIKRCNFNLHDGKKEWQKTSQRRISLLSSRDRLQRESMTMIHFLSLPPISENSQTSLENC